MIVIAQYEFAYQAHIAKASLAQAGIDSEISDEHSNNALHYRLGDLVNVRLWVHESDAKAALKVLDTDFSADVDAYLGLSGQEDCCVKCGSDQLVAMTKFKKPTILSWLLPLFCYKKGYYCKACDTFFPH